jgi:hypothetical protein
MTQEFTGCYISEGGEMRNVEEPELVLQKGVYQNGKEFLLKLNGESFPLMLGDLKPLAKDLFSFKHEGVKYQYYQAFENEVLISYQD